MLFRHQRDRMTVMKAPLGDPQNITEQKMQSIDEIRREAAEHVNSILREVSTDIRNAVVHGDWRRVEESFKKSFIESAVLRTNFEDEIHQARAISQAKKLGKRFSLEKSDGSFIGGAGKGAVIGAAAGSVFPIIGTTAGAIIGGFFGLYKRGIMNNGSEIHESLEKYAREQQSLIEKVIF